MIGLTRDATIDRNLESASGGRVSVGAVLAGKRTRGRIPESEEVSIIPTSHKSKLPKELSWPLGAEAISQALVDVPDAVNLTLSFWALPVRLVREALPYALLVAEYKPAQRLGFSGMNSLIETGWYEAKWQLRVKPVLRTQRAIAGTLLREQGLPALAEWLRSSVRPGWGSRQHQLSLVFNPTEGTVTAQVAEGV